MPFKLRILNAASRTMQRAGYLKYLCALAARTDTSNLPSLGRQLIAAVSKRVRVEPPFAEPLRAYVRVRLLDRVYADLRKAVLSNPPAAVSLELQDLYLADPTLPSNTGKLVERDWRFYPYLATSLDFIKLGTYSAMTRALVLLAVTPKEELAAFDQHCPAANPLRISAEQSAVLLYCFADNDGEVVQPLFSQLAQRTEPAFDERAASDLLPAILRKAISTAQKQSLVHEDRERLTKLTAVADNIEAWRDRPYTGSGSREEAIRPRLEPYCDVGLFTKLNKHRFIYQTTPALPALLEHWPSPVATDDFLGARYFAAVAAMHNLKPAPATTGDARAALEAASKLLKSSLGYTPITDLALLAGIHLLFRQNRLLEIKAADAILTGWQKEAPEIVRFTVDRMGNRAYVKFLKPAPLAPAPANA